MPDTGNPRISARKQPRQARSRDLLAAILEAATQVLSQQGAHRFTTARIAEKAGVSVGSIYQYFPNKAAILFRLQTDEWRQTTDLLRRILEDTTQPPPHRIHALVQAFLRSECEEAALRTALKDAAPFYRSAPEAREAKSSGKKVFHAFLKQALPQTPPEARKQAAGLLLTTLSAVGKQYSESPRTPAEITLFANSLSTMFNAYLAHLAQPG